LFSKCLVIIHRTSSADNNLNTTAVTDTGLISKQKYLVREHRKKENSVRRMSVCCDEQQAGRLSASSEEKQRWLYLATDRD
jgi:hypothetical protein